MPKRSSNNGAKSRRSKLHLPELVDRRLIQALNHPLRQHILLSCIKGEISPKELAERLGAGLSQVSYHVKVLHEDCNGMIELTRTEPRRGAVEHYYQASEKTLLPAKAWRRLKAGLRAVAGAGQASDAFDDLAGAARAGKLTGSHDHIARTPLILDDEGERRVAAIAQRATTEVEDEQRKATERLARANGDGKAVGYTFAVLAFEAAWGGPALHVAVTSSAQRPPDKREPELTGVDPVSHNGHRSRPVCT